MKNHQIDAAISDMIAEEHRTKNWPMQRNSPDPQDLEMLLMTHRPYFFEVVQQFEQVQQHLMQAQQLEQQAQALRTEAQAKLGAHNSYVQHLFREYGLTPGQDRIDPTGRIIRVDQPQPGHSIPGSES